MSLGSLVVNLSANTAQFTSDMGKAAHQAAKDMDMLKRQAAIAGAAIGSMFTASLGMAAVFTKSTINAADEMGKMAQKVGLSVEALSALKYAGDLSDVSLESLTTGLKQLGKSIDSGDDAFKRLFPSMTKSQIQALSTEQALNMIADRFATMKDGAGKTALAMEFFSKSGADLIPLLNGGSAGLAEMANEAERAGVIISTQTAKAAEDFNDNMTRLNTSLKGVGMTLADPLIKNLGLMSNQMMAARDATDSWTEAMLIGFNRKSVSEKIVDITFQLDKLRVKQKELEESGSGRPIRFIGDQLQATKNQIANLEKELGTLQKVRSNVNAMEAATDAAAARKNQGGGAPQRKDNEAIKAREAALRAAAAEQKKLLSEIADYNRAVDDAQSAAIESARRQADEIDAESQRKKDLSKKNLDSIREGLLNEQELLAVQYEKKLEDLRLARESELLTESEYNELAVELEQEHMDHLAEIRKSKLTDLEKFTALSFRNQTKTVTGMLADMTAGVASQSRAMFEINKIAGVANVILKAHESISNAYAFGSAWGGPVGGAAMAAVAIAATAAQIAAISGAQFGGGGGTAPSVAGSTAATPVSPVTGGAPGQAQGGPGMTVVLESGGSFSDRQVLELIERINDVARGGSRILVRR